MPAPSCEDTKGTLNLLLLMYSGFLDDPPLNMWELIKSHKDKALAGSYSPPSDFDYLSATPLPQSVDAYINNLISGPSNIADAVKSGFPEFFERYLKEVYTFPFNFIEETERRLLKLKLLPDAPLNSPVYVSSDYELLRYALSSGVISSYVDKNKIKEYLDASKETHIKQAVTGRFLPFNKEQDGICAAFLRLKHPSSQYRKFLDKTQFLTSIKKKRRRTPDRDFISLNEVTQTDTWGLALIVSDQFINRKPNEIVDGVYDFLTNYTPSSKDGPLHIVRFSCVGTKKIKSGSSPRNISQINLKFIGEDGRAYTVIVDTPQGFFDSHLGTNDNRPHASHQAGKVYMMYNKAISALDREIRPLLSLLPENPFQLIPPKNSKRKSPLYLACASNAPYNLLSGNLKRQLLKEFPSINVLAESSDNMHIKERVYESFIKNLYEVISHNVNESYKRITGSAVKKSAASPRHRVVERVKRTNILRGKDFNLEKILKGMSGHSSKELAKPRDYFIKDFFSLSADGYSLLLKYLISMPPPLFVDSDGNPEGYRSNSLFSRIEKDILVLKKFAKENPSIKPHKRRIENPLEMRVVKSYSQLTELYNCLNSLWNVDERIYKARLLTMRNETSPSIEHLKETEQRLDSAGTRISKMLAPGYSAELSIRLRRVLLFHYGLNLLKLADSKSGGKKPSKHTVSVYNRYANFVSPNDPPLIVDMLNSDKERYNSLFNPSQPSG